MLSPPSYVQLLGTAVSVDADLALEPPVPLSVWHQEVCAAACLSHNTRWAKRVVAVARKAMLAHVAVLSPASKSKIKLDQCLMLVPTSSITEFSFSPQCLLRGLTTASFLIPNLRLAPGPVQLPWQSDGAASPLRRVTGVSALREPPGLWLGVEGSISRGAAVHKAVFR